MDYIISLRAWPPLDFLDKNAHLMLGSTCGSDTQPFTSTGGRSSGSSWVSFLAVLPGFIGVQIQIEYFEIEPRRWVQVVLRGRPQMQAQTLAQRDGSSAGAARSHIRQCSSVACQEHAARKCSAWSAGHTHAEVPVGAVEPGCHQRHVHHRDACRGGSTTYFWPG